MTSPTTDTTRAKIADQPHHWTLLLSITALIISMVGLGASCLSLYESHMARKLNEATSRAMVQTSSIKLLSSWSWENKKSKPNDISIEISLTNSGRSLSKGIEVKITLAVAFGITQPGENIPQKTTSNLGWAKLLPDDLGPGSTAFYRMKVDTQQAEVVAQNNLIPPGEITDLILSPHIEYEDVATHNRFVDDSCFRLTADKNGVITPDSFLRCPAIGRATVTIP